MQAVQDSEGSEEERAIRQNAIKLAEAVYGGPEGVRRKRYEPAAASEAG